MAAKKSAKKVSKKGSKNAKAKPTGDVAARLKEIFPDSVVRLLRVIATAVAVGKNGTVEADPTIAANLGAALAPNDKKQADAIANLVSKATKDWAKHHESHNVTTPIF